MKNNRVCILDYGSGNVGSLFNLLNNLKYKVKISNDPEDIKERRSLLIILGALAPDALEEIGIKEDIFLFSVDIESLKTKSLPKFKEFSKYPSSQRDLSFVVHKDVTSHALSALIMDKGGKDLKDLDLFDVYEGKGIDSSKKSIAISLTWQSSKGTLLDSDIDKIVEKIVNSVKKELDGDLRG